jgi:hypothetical protein
MRKPDIKSMLERLGQSKLAAKVAQELGGNEAQAGLLVECGYANQPDGLATRVAVELERALPLAVDSASLQSYGGLFDGLEVMARTRREADDLLPAFPEQGAPPASQLELSPEEIHHRWTWISGGRSLRLARAWRLSGDPNIALACGRSLERFCRHNPPLMNWGWLDHSHLAVRAFHWIWALRFLGDLAVLKSETVMLTILQLRVIGQVLAQDLENKRQGFGPVDVASAGALLYMGRCLPFLPESTDWWTLGQTVLGPALGGYSQFMPLTGAVPTAQVRQAADWGSMGLWLARHSGVELIGLEDALRDLAIFCRSSAPPWGAGLSWDWQPGGALMELDGNQVDPFTQAANLAAVLLDDPNVRAGRVMDERLFWLFGPRAEEALRRLAGGADLGSLDLPAAGLSGLAVENQGRRMTVWLRTSPRYAGLEHRGANDALSLAVAVDGQPLIVTPGPAGSGPLAPYLESRAAHNALVVDEIEPGRGQVNIEGLESSGRQGFCVASYDGYSSLDDPVELRRRVFLDGTAGIINLVDQVSAQGQHICELFFHLPPSARVERDPEGSVLLTGSFGRAWLRADNNAEVRIARGRSHPQMGWLALEPGEITAAPVIALRLEVTGNARITTTITLES